MRTEFQSDSVEGYVCIGDLDMDWRAIQPKVLGKSHRLLFFHYILSMSRGSSVGIATAYGLDDRRVAVRVLIGSRIFSISSRQALGPTQPPIQWVPGVLSPGVKRQGREAHHSPPASAEVKKMWIYTSTPPYAFMA
jgi:hypothetical protein